MHQRLLRLEKRLTRSVLSALAGACVLASTTIHAGVIFTDNFDTGSTAGPQNGAAWRAPTSTVQVSSAQSFTPSYSLQFTYAGVASGQDGMAQATMDLPQRSEMWFHYKLYIPSNYVHRSDGASNNKFLAVYAAPYQTPGFQINLSTEPNGSGGSNLEIHHYNNGSEQTVVPAASNFIATPDLGKWMDLVIQVRVPTSGSSANGIVAVWKNGKQITNVTNLQAYGGSSNYINQCYFLGWANSGFANTTYLYIDQLTIADSSLLSNTQPTNTPDPPTLTVN
jgi:hypothetical protein